MSTKLSFREALARPGSAKAGSPVRSASRRVRLILRADEITRPVDLAPLLARHGLSLRRAHEMLQRLARGESVAAAFETPNASGIRAELAKLGIVARAIKLPAADVRRIREHFGLSQSEFAIRFGFEIDTVQNWEQGRNRPDQAAQLLLKIIESYPEDVEAVLTGADASGS